MQNIEALREAVKEGRFEWRMHALQKILERGISLTDVKNTLVAGEIIKEYPKDKPFPSCLVLGFTGQEPLHVVTGLDKANQTVHIITAYRPGLNKFEKDFKTRKLR